ncbi:uncharacterized protein ACJ7VT_005359 [Polymixia lowei]
MNRRSLFLLSAVSMLPSFSMIFSGDTIYLTCDNSGGNTVQWYVNNKVIPGQADQTFTIAVATPDQSGDYACGASGRRSQDLSISVLDYVPPAELSILTGQPVMRVKDAFTLKLENDDGLQKWKCWVYKNGSVRGIGFRGSHPDNNTRSFQPSQLRDPMAIYWCSDKTNRTRSSQVTIRTSAKPVLLETPPRPVLIGQNFILKCIVWGTDKILRTVFYKDEAVMQDGSSSTYHIKNVKASSAGKYKCDATFHYKGSTGPLSQLTSDAQDLLVQEPPLKTVISVGSGLSCSCPECPNDASYQWYYQQQPEQLWAPRGSGRQYLQAMDPGSYTCRAVWTNKRTLMSAVHTNDVGPQGVIMVIVIIGLVLVGALVAAIFLYKRKRSAQEPIYQDVPMTGVKPSDGDGGYDQLRKKGGADRDGEYDTLMPPAGVKKEGDYEPLKKGEVQADYHTVGAQGAEGGEAGYEALKKGEVKADVYHMLGAQGAEAGEAGYEALKKGEVKADVYHMLGAQGAEGGEAGKGGEAGYEALKKRDAGGDYETLADERK